MDPPLAKTEPVSDISCTSTIMFLRKGEKHCAAAVREEGENVSETALQTSKSVKKQRRRSFSCQSKDSPAAHGGLHVGKHGCALRETAAHVKLTQEKAFGRNCSLWREAHAGAGFLAEPAAMERSPHWRSPFPKDCTPRNGPMLKQLSKNCSPWEGLTWEELMKDCIL